MYHIIYWMGLWKFDGKDVLVRLDYSDMASSALEYRCVED